MASSVRPRPRRPAVNPASTPARVSPRDDASAMPRSSGISSRDGYPLLPAVPRDTVVADPRPVDDDSEGDAEFAHRLHGKPQIVQSEASGLRHQYRVVAVLHRLDRRARHSGRSIDDDEIERRSPGQVLDLPDHRSGPRLAHVQAPPPQVDALDEARSDATYLPAPLGDRHLRAGVGADAATVAEFGQQERAAGKSDQRVEPAGASARATSGADSVVDVGDHGRHRGSGGEGRPQVQVAVGLLDVAIEKPDRRFFRHHQRQIDRHRGLPGAALAAGYNDLHSARPSFYQWPSTLADPAGRNWP